MTLSYPIIYKKVAFPPLQPAKPMVYYRGYPSSHFCPPNTPAAGSTQKEYCSVMVRITMEDGGIIDIELNEEVAPITCENFKKLVNEGFYNGLTFHRVIPGFMIQGGCPLGTGTGGPGWNIKGEFAANGVNNPLKHTRGVISMARSMNPNSAGSQFFIMHQDAPHLDGQYAAFGKVVAGMDVVDKIAAVRTDWNDKPTTPVKMKTVELIEG